MLFLLVLRNSTARQQSLAYVVTFRYMFIGPTPPPPPVLLQMIFVDR